jgi:uncharacterized protein YggE
MRTSPIVKPAAKIPFRPILLALVVVGLAMAGLALLAEAMSGGGGTVYLANINSGSNGAIAQPNIEVVGYGVAKGPAERAVLQMLIVRDQPFAESSQPTPGVSTTTGTMTPTSNSDRGSMTPVINALLVAGVKEEQIVVLSSPSLIAACTNSNRCSSTRIDVTVEQPTIEFLNTVVNAVGQEVAQAGMTLQDVGVGYTVNDCSVLTRQARELATSDAKTRASQQAEVLGVALGQLLVSSELAPETPRDATGCPALPSGYADSWWTAGSSGLTVPAFDPGVAPQASVTVQVALAYAIGEGEPENTETVT